MFALYSSPNILLNISNIQSNSYNNKNMKYK